MSSNHSKDLSFTLREIVRSDGCPLSIKGVPFKYNLNLMASSIFALIEMFATVANPV